MKKYFIIILLIAMASCVNKSEILHQYSGEAQGTFFNIKYYNHSTDSLNNQIDSILDSFDLIASIYNDSSILSRVNRNETTDISPEFVELFNKSINFSMLSNGYFDITVEPLVSSWGFYKKRSFEPDSAVVDSILKYVGFNKVKLENGKIIKDFPNIKLDFNAIAQGYSVDLICKYFETHNIKNYIVEIGGEVRVGGHKPDNSNWIVGVEKPAETPEAPQSILKKLAVSDLSIATSGNSRKFYEKNGIKYSHTINPKTGYPVTHSLLSVTVITKLCADADAWATSFMVMGIENAKKILAQNPDIAAFFIYCDQNGKLQTISENNFDKYFLE